ncbi:MAG: type II secretion system protein [Elusimicrobia bacterium]|nr:type II secretion system protein [Elusimicrobiota bacterium]
MNKRKRSIEWEDCRGLTMTELVIVVAMIAILSMIALPRFANLIRKANERTSVAKLRSLRVALTIYYSDNEQQYPSDLSVFMTPGSAYMKTVGPFYTVEHGNLSEIDYVAAVDPNADTGRLGYVTTGPDMGTAWIECTHTNLENRVWSEY